jgi:hypothetical protein
MTGSNTFVDAANGDFHLVSASAVGATAGLSDPGSGLFSDDMDGQTRTGTWNRGPDQFVTVSNDLNALIGEPINGYSALN